MNSEKTMSRILIVVPEGLSSVAGSPLPSPAYRASLEAAKKIAQEGDIIVLAPANKFNFPKFEQDYAREYLENIAPYLDIRVASTFGQKYVDTMGNASLVNEQMQPLGLMAKTCIS